MVWILIIILEVILWGQRGVDTQIWVDMTWHDPNLKFSDPKPDYMILSAFPLGLALLHCQGSKSKWLSWTDIRQTCPAWLWACAGLSLPVRWLCNSFNFHAMFVSTGKSTVNSFLNNAYDLISLAYKIHCKFSLKDFQWWIFQFFFFQFWYKNEWNQFYTQLILYTSCFQSKSLYFWLLYLINWNMLSNASKKY